MLQNDPKSDKKIKIHFKKKDKIIIKIYHPDKQKNIKSILLYQGIQNIHSAECKKNVQNIHRKTMSELRQIKNHFFIGGIVCSNLQIYKDLLNLFSYILKIYVTVILEHMREILYKIQLFYNTNLMIMISKNNL